MTTLTFDWETGVVKGGIAQLPEKMLEVAFEVLMERAHLMRDLAQVYVRVDTGSLRHSIRVERGGEGAHWRRVRVRAGGYITNPKTGKIVNYAVHVEKNYPYMRPAWEAIKDDVKRAIESRIVEAVT